LEVAVGIAEGGDGAATNVQVDGKRLSLFVVDRRVMTGFPSRTSYFVLMLLPITCSGGMP
jgi:hypothetical protein